MKKSKGYARGGRMKSKMSAKGMSKGGKLPMVEKGGKQVPFFAADGKGKMANGGAVPTTKGYFRGGKTMNTKGSSAGGKMKSKGMAAGGTVARGSGAARTQYFRKNG
jgi:hypothetical protein|tara:strand:- start:162 stop:482 length:321 start_codon:yes stop_codon:yes gene_type:complete